MLTRVNWNQQFLRKPEKNMEQIWETCKNIEMIYVYLYMMNYYLMYYLLIFFVKDLNQKL